MFYSYPLLFLYTIIAVNYIRSDKIARNKKNRLKKKKQCIKKLLRVYRQKFDHSEQVQIQLVVRTVADHPVVEQMAQRGWKDLVEIQPFPGP